MPENVILVDERDQEIGSEEKIAAHRAGKLHRAFSVFIFNSEGKLLLQNRARIKYHSGGLWTNTCCSHPRPGEDTESAAHRRLREEMGFDCDLKKTFGFIYRIQFDHQLSEHEFDHVFIGTSEQNADPDPNEVGRWRWSSLGEIKKELATNPENYTYWFRIAFEKLLVDHLHRGNMFASTSEITISSGG